MKMRTIGLALLVISALGCGDGAPAEDRDADTSSDDDAGRRRRRDAGCMEAEFDDSSFDRSCFGP